MNSQQEQNITHNMQSRFYKILDNLPSELNHFFTSKPIEQWRMIKSHDLNNLQQTLNMNLNDLTLMLLPFAAAYAHTPISQFNVGAIVIDERGDLYFGANFEFAHTHMAQTIHAEQSAISHAWMSGAGALKLLVVNYPPCGHCRQFINETKRSDDFKIQLPQRQAQSFDYYLPESFGPDDLDVSARILQSDNSHQQHPLPAEFQAQKDALAAQAYQAFLLSHSPYSHSESGIAIEYDDGEIVKGSYGENAAFNPSLPPLQVALNYRRMLGKRWDGGLRRACLVENNKNMTQRQNTEILLRSFTDCPLDYKVITE